ncbi:MAG: MATE family efflux transporter [Clostridia bacterium]|nr:MATE family efflux transporter [Clostridia bacterium]
MKKIFTDDKRFYKTLITLAIPMILQNLITFSVGLADNMMIGSLGDSAVSGVYMGNQIQIALQVLSAGIEAAILLISSQYWGKRDTESIRKIFSIGLRISAILGLFFTTVCAVFPRQVISVFTKESGVINNGVEYLSIICFTYIFFCITQALIASMRSVESAKVGMVVSFCSLVIDVTLNYILIFGKLGFRAMGVRGAAVATLIARICETIIISTYVRFVDKKVQLRGRDLLKLDRTLLKDFIRYGLPLVAGQLVWGANLMANSIILGHFTESVITATSLANTINSLMYVAMNGVSGSIGIIIGKTVGSGDISRIKEYARTTQLILLSLGVVISLVFLAVRDPFISFYNITEESADYAKQFINVLRVTCIGTCYQAGSLMGLIKSGGDVSFVFKNDTIFVFGVVIPSAIITSICGCPAWVVYACLKCDQVLKCIPAFFKIRRYNWMKNLTRTNEK